MRGNGKRQTLRLELINILRSKRFILLAVVLPLIIYPLLMFGFTSTNDNTILVLDEVTIGFSTEPSGELEKAIEESEVKYKINIETKVNNYRKALQAGEINAYFHISDKEDGLIYTIYIDKNIGKNMDVLNQLEKAISDYNNVSISSQVISSEDGLKSAVYNFVQVDPQLTVVSVTKDIIEESVVVSLPYILILNMMIVCLYIAVMTRLKNNNMGEVETLISSGLIKVDIMNNKYLVVLVGTIINAMTSLICITISGTIIYMMNKPLVQELLDKAKIEIRLIHIIISIVYILIAIGIMATLITTICVYISSLARRCSKLITIILLPIAIWVLWSQIHFFVYTNMKSVSFDEFVGAYGIIQLTNLFSYTVVITYIVIKFFDKDRIIFGIDNKISFMQNRNNMQKNRLPNPMEALLTYAIIMLAIELLSVLDIYVNLQIFGASVAMLVAIYFKLDIKKTFSLKLPKFKHIIGALVIYVAMFIMGGMVSAKVNELLPVEINAHQEIINSMHREAKSIWPLILDIGVSAGIFEEMMFRGIILSGLTNKNNREIRKRSGVFAILISSILFAFIHIDIRSIIAIMIHGTLLGFIVYKTGSIYLSMFVHFLNNTLLTIVQYYIYSDFARTFANLQSATKEINITNIALIVVLITAATILFRKTKKERQEDSTELLSVNI